MKNLFSVSYDDFEKKNGYLYIMDNLKCKKMWTTNRNFVFGFRMPQIAKGGGGGGGGNMGPTWVLSAPDGPHVGPWTLLSGAFSFEMRMYWGEF